MPHCGVPVPTGLMGVLVVTPCGVPVPTGLVAWGDPARAGLGGVPRVAEGGVPLPMGLAGVPVVAPWAVPVPAGPGGRGGGGRQGLGGAAPLEAPGGGVGGGSGRRKMKADSVRLRWYRRKGRRAPGGDGGSAETPRAPRAPRPFRDTYRGCCRPGGMWTWTPSAPAAERIPGGSGCAGRPGWRLPAGSGV